MEQVKLFYEYNINDVESIEEEVNKWLRNNENIIIIQRNTKFDNDNVFISIFYKKGVTL